MTPQDKLKQLGHDWEAYPQKRATIEFQAKIVKKSMDYCSKGEKNDLKLQEEVVKNLF